MIFFVQKWQKWQLFVNKEIKHTAIYQMPEQHLSHNYLIMRCTSYGVPITLLSRVNAKE